MPPMSKGEIPTGLAFEVPWGCGLDIRPRSGLASSGLIISNAPGTLDSDYRGELIILCRNLLASPFLVPKGDRVAQIRLFETTNLTFEVVEELSKTERGTGGFGSTGR